MQRGNRTRVVLAAAVSLLSYGASSRAAEVAVKEKDDGAVVTIDGEPFCEYVNLHGHQPIIWPIYGPDGQAMTRQYPMGELQPTEQDDHLHHRSLWCNHGVVNGKDFVGSSRVDLQACKLEYSIVSPK